MSNTANPVPTEAADDAIARMFEKLAKNASPTVTVELEKPRVKLEWLAPVWTNEAKTHGYIVSACERYMIDKADSSYNAYRRGTLRQHAGMYLGNLQSSDAAKTLCEQDVNR